jgi:hypothetical protein
MTIKAYNFIIYTMDLYQSWNLILGGITQTDKFFNGALPKRKITFMEDYLKR